MVYRLPVISEVNVQMQLTSSPPLYFFLMLLRSMAVWSLVDFLHKFFANTVKPEANGIGSCGPLSLNKFALSMRLMVVMPLT